ncbi:MAG: O-antigen ligase family protein [Candidatus Pacebacteria bacterium]|nr:O-antigen ligase family protein [Candidatus Paceibacterota bacterium]
MKKALRYVVLGGLFVIPFLPLYVEYGFFFPFITGKGFAFRIIVELIVVAWGVLLLLEPKYRPQHSPLLVIYGGLVLWMVVANLLGVNPHKAFWSNFERMDGWVTLVHVFMFFVVSGTVLTADKLWQKWWQTFIVGAGVVSAYAVLQLAGLLTIHQSGVRVDATIGNAAYLAAYLLFAIPVTIWQALVSKGNLRYALYALAFVEIVVLFATATRGALIGFVVATFAGLVYALWQSTGKSKKIIVGVLLLCVTTVSLFVALRSTPLIAEDPTLSRIASISTKELGVRFTLWGMGITGALERPLTGWGQEGFNYIYNANYKPELFAQEPWFDRAHNVYLDWFVAGGLPALLLFLSLLGVTLVTLARKNINPIAKILLTCALIGYGVQGLVVFDNLFSYVPLAAIIAMVHGFSAKPYTTRASGFVFDSATVQTLVLPVVLPVGLVLVYLVNIQSMLSAHHLIQALSPWPDPQSNVAAFEAALADNSFAKQEIREQLVVMAAGAASNQNINPDIRLKMLTLAVTEMQAQLQASPGDARLWLQLAYAYRAGGDFESAHKAIAEARKLSPVKQSLIVEDGTLYWQQQRYELAHAEFQRAYDLGSVRFPELAVNLAASSARLGNEEESDALLTEHFGTTTVNRQMLIIAYGELENYRRLIPLLELKVREQPQDALSILQLATAYAQNGRTTEAKNLVQEIMRSTQDPALLQIGANLLTQFKTP